MWLLLSMHGVRLLFLHLSMYLRSSCHRASKEMGSGTMYLVLSALLHVCIRDLAHTRETHPARPLRHLLGKLISGPGGPGRACRAGSSGK